MRNCDNKEQKLSWEVTVKYIRGASGILDAEIIPIEPDPGNSGEGSMTATGAPVFNSIT